MKEYTIEEILSKVDHTLLKPEATWAEVKTLIDEGVAYHTASVCISPCFIKQAKAYAADRIRLCTVIGFPNGCMTTEAKVFETENAVSNGADEIDMVINIGWLKEKKAAALLEEINRIKTACNGKLLKVIVETCLLTEEEKKLICEIVSSSNADYIKTSTGFSKGGATFEDVRLLKEYCIGKKVKAAGGISSIDDAKRFLALGADRLGTSRIVKLAKEIKPL